MQKELDLQMLVGDTIKCEAFNIAKKMFKTKQNIDKGFSKSI